MIQANWLEVVNALIATVCLTVATLTCWFWVSDYRAKLRKPMVVPVRRFMVHSVAFVTKVILFVAVLMWGNSLWGVWHSPPPPFTAQSLGNLFTNITITSIMTFVLILGLYWRQQLNEGDYPGAPTDRRNDGAPIQAVAAVSALTNASSVVSAAASQVAQVAATEAAAVDVALRNGASDD